MSPGNDSHEHWRDDVAAYAVGGLEENEAAGMQKHLETCETCRADLARLQPAVESLPESVEQLAAPPALRERVMAIVRSDAAAASADRLAEDAGDRALARPRRRRGLGALLRPIPVAMVLAVVVAGVAGYTLKGGGTNTSTVAAFRADGAGQASAALVRKGDSGTLRFTGMAPLRKGEVYEAWVRTDGEAEGASLFVPRTDGTAAAAIPEGLNHATEVIVTREARGGGTVPSQPLLRAPLR